MCRYMVRKVKLKKFDVFILNWWPVYVKWKYIMGKLYTIYIYVYIIYV
jgi:hypothetical protein